jgi:ferredoxin
MGVGTCEQIAPEVFHARNDGLWAVKEDAAYFGALRVFDGSSAPDGFAGMARVPSGLEDYVVDAAEQCPGECVHLDA